MESFKKGSDEFNFMADFYGYCKEFYEIKDAETWQRATDKCKEIYGKYKCKEFMFGLFCGFFEYANGSAKKEIEKIKRELVKGA